MLWRSRGALEAGSVLLGMLSAKSLPGTGSHARLVASVGERKKAESAGCFLPRVSLVSRCETPKKRLRSQAFWF